LVAVSLAFIMVPFMAMAIMVALPSIGSDLGIDAVVLGWLVTAFIMASAVFVIPAGRIADIYGRRKIFLLGITISTLSSLFLGLSSSVPLLIFLRVIQGLGMAMIINTGVAIISSVFTAGQRGRALGITTAAIFAGQTLSYFIGGVLTQHLGWRSVFLLNVPFGLLVIIFVFTKLTDEWAEARGEKLDIPGTLIYAVMLVMVIYGFSLLPALTGVGLIGGGILAGYVFIKWETKVQSPIVNLNLFKKNRTFALSSLASLINYSSVQAIAFLLSLYMQYIMGLSPQSAGLVLIAQPFVLAVLSPLAGRLADIVQPRILVSIGMVITTLVLAQLIFLNPDTSIARILAIFVLSGIGMALFDPPNTNAIMGSVGKAYYGIASGTVATMRQLGMIVSMAITMLLFSFYIGRVEITPDYYPSFLKSMRAAFTVFAFLGCLGIVTSLARGKIKDPPDTPIKGQ
jgi:MFS family permease